MRTTDSAIILAGGRSLRMGFDKQLLRLNDEYLLAKNLELMLSIFPEVIVVSNEPDYLKEIKHIDQTKIVADVYEGRGPLGGIHAGLAEISSDFAFVLAVDMPVLDRDHILKMKLYMTEAEAGDGLVNINASSGEPEPFFAFYGKHLLPELEQAILSNRRSLRRFIDRHDFIRLDYPSGEIQDKDIFFNINDKEGFRKFHEMQSPGLQSLSSLEVDENTPVIQSMPVIRYKGTVHKELADDVITEAEISLYINGSFFQTMYCTPKDLPELITGNLYAQGRIQAAVDLIDLIITRRPDPDLVLYDVHAQVAETEALKEAARVDSRVFTTSGSSRPAIPFAGSLSKEDTDLELDMERIMEISGVFQDTSALFARTGGNHACAIIEDGEMISFMEDIGRHNALDKLIGKALMEGRDLSRAMILLSGRMASEMTMKVLRTPVSVLLSRSAPTDRSVQLARDNNLTMVGFIRGQRLNIYHLNRGHRIKGYESAET